MAVISDNTGMGVVGRDKLQEIRPDQSFRTEMELMLWYRAVKFISKPVSMFAEEMYREGFQIQTGNESLDSEIHKVLDEMDFEKKAITLEKYKMIFRNGGLMYFLFDSQIPQTDNFLKEPVPQDAKLSCINVLPAYDFSVFAGETDPLRKTYYRPSIRIGGNTVHSERYCWLVDDYDGRLNSGKSLVDSLIQIGSGMDISLWSLVNMVYEAQVKVYKSNPVRDGGKNIVEKLISKIKSTMSSQSVAVIGETESFDKLNFQAQGLDQATNFLWEVLGALSPVPANVLKGQSKRVISLSNDPDMISFYSNVERAQERAERQYIRKAVKYIICCLGYPETEFEIKWNPLYILDDNTKADIALKTAQTDVQYITSGVLNPQDVMAERFPEVGTVSNNPNTDFNIPDLTEPA